MAAAVAVALRRQRSGPSVAAGATRRADERTETPVPPPYRLEADLLLVLTTLIAAAGWIFSRRRSPAHAADLHRPALRHRRAGAGTVLAAAVRALDRRGLRNSLLVGALFAGGMVLWILGLSQ